MTTTLAFLPPGTLLNHGNYRIEEKIGQGGFGITYRATMIQLKKEVVIKELFFRGHSVRITGDSTVSIQSLEKAQYDQVKDRFIKEGQTLAQFDHPNIMRVNFIFEENNTVYLVLEYIKGQSLRELIDSKGRLSTKTACDYVLQVADALQVIHARNILHRDIKPSNIMITPEGKAVLIDFGIAKQFADDKTISNTAAHTPGFAPIEQYSGRRRLGPYTDIYSLSATLYFAVTGKRPIDATDRLDEDLEAPNRINAAINASMNNFILKGMEIKSDHRFQNIREFKAGLANLDADKATSFDTNTNQLAYRAEAPKTELDFQPVNQTPVYATPNRNEIPTQVQGQDIERVQKRRIKKGSTLEGEMRYANFGVRLAAFILDSIFLLGFILFYSYMLVDELDVFYDYDDETFALFTVIAGNLVSWLYYAVLESSGIRGTFGKRLVNIKVTNLRGEKISFGRATGRFFGKFLSGLILFIGYLMITFSKKRQGLHDMLAGTLILKR